MKEITRFEKKGIEFVISIDKNNKIIVEAVGHKVTAIPYKHYQHGWYYEIISKALVSAIGGRGDKMYLTHESAEYADKVQKEAMKELKLRQDENRRQSELGRRHLALVQYDSGTEIALVVKMTTEEETEYREEYRGKMHYQSIDSKHNKVNWNLESVQRIKSRPVDGYAVQGGAVWYISDAEMAIVNKENTCIAEEKAAIKAEEKAKQEAERSAKFEKAKQSGVPVVLRALNVECDDPQEECSLDIITEYAMPDGSTSTKRQHTW